MSSHGHLATLVLTLALLLRQFVDRSIEVGWARGVLGQAGQQSVQLVLRNC